MEVRDDVSDGGSVAGAMTGGVMAVLRCSNNSRVYDLAARIESFPLLSWLSLLVVLPLLVLSS
jgi:hypothetical protein